MCSTLFIFYYKSNKFSREKARKILDLIKVCATILLYPVKNSRRKQMLEHGSDFIEDSKIMYDIEDTKDTTNLTALGRALSSPVRIQMIAWSTRKICLRQR